MTGARFHARATRLAPFPRVLYVVPAILSAVALWLVADGEMLGFFLQVLAVLLGGILFARRPRPRRAVRVWVDPDGVLYLGSERFAEPGAVTTILASGVGNRALVSIERDDGVHVDLELESPAHVAELRATLAATGARMAAQGFRGHVPFGVDSLAIILAAVVLGIVLAGRYGFTHPVLVSLAVPLLFTGLPLAVAALRTYSVRVGAEGVWLRRTTSRSRGRLILHRDLTAREGRLSHMVNLYEHDTRAVALELGNANEAHALTASLRHRRELENPGGGEMLEARLARGERGAADWLDDLKKHADPRGDGYRVAKVSAEQLWAVLENPEADQSAGIGAAVTLRVQAEGEADVRERLRIAAGATALPEVRHAAEILGDAEDEQVALVRLARTLG